MMSIPRLGGWNKALFIYGYLGVNYVIKTENCVTDWMAKLGNFVASSACD